MNQIANKILRFILLFLIPVLLAIATIRLIPESIPISFDYTCNSGPDGNVQCTKARSNSLSTKLEDIEHRINVIERMSAFFRPLSKIISYDINAANDSTVVLQVSAPHIERKTGVDVICSFDPKFYTKRAYSLEQLVGIIAKFIDNVSSCRLPSKVQVTDQEFGWDSGAWLTVTINELYMLKWSPDTYTWIFLYIIYLLVSITALPMIKQMTMFINKGYLYFSNDTVTRGSTKGNRHSGSRSGPLGKVGFFLYSYGDKKVLLHKRDDRTAESPNMWDHFGGAFEAEDQGKAEEALKRELHEELGVLVNNTDLRILWSDSDFYYVLFPQYRTKDLKLGEGAGFAWFSIDEALGIDDEKITQDAKTYLRQLKKAVEES